MSNRIDLALTATPSPTTTAARATDPTAGAQFRQALARVASTALSGVERLLPFAPGGVAMTSALAGGTSSGSVAGAIGAVSTGGNPNASLPGNTSSLVQDSADQALELIALQQQISTEQRQFTTVSNVMKARNDTVKNLIGNVR